MGVGLGRRIRGSGTSTGWSWEDFRSTALFTTEIAVLGVVATAFVVPMVRGISRAQADTAKFFGDASAFAG